MSQKKLIKKILFNKKKNNNFILSFNKININSYQNIKNKLFNEINIQLPQTVIVTPYTVLNNIKENSTTFLIKHNNILFFPKQIEKIKLKFLIKTIPTLFYQQQKLYNILQTLSKNYKNF